MLTPLVDFLCRCSGIREDALRLAPSGRVMAATHWLLLLAVALFSSAAAAYAVQRVFVTSSLSPRLPPQPGRATCLDKEHRRRYGSSDLLIRSSTGTSLQA